jgi:4-hydroxybenzoate polyprenyltransferase
MIKKLTSNAYWRLLRCHKPAGILLLWYPTAWALWVANHGFPPWSIFFLLSLGTLLMRSAGCVFNDIADRKIDSAVARTQLRPITCGEISLFSAFICLFLLLAAALSVVIWLPRPCFYCAVFALLISLIYPFCKRFFKAPQLVLGLAFSMGIPMAYLASGKLFDKNMAMLFLLNFIWILAYDTMYAMTDKADDLKIGVKSTAICFGNYDILFVGILLSVLHSLWLFWALLGSAHIGFYGFWLIAAWVLFYQQQLIRSKIPKNCLRAFTISVYYGFFMCMALIAC